MGGCVSSHGRDVNNRRHNVFQVWNVDELGNVFMPGQIEVTDTELVLHQKGKLPIRWPMRCLRRYGFDAELFSFESGRRCATGSGIYAFKCQRAETLFNLLQEQIQNSGHDNNHTTTTDSIGGIMNSRSGVGNGIVVASAAAANGSILRSVSASVSDGTGNYLEPIVRHRTQSINNNNNNNNNNSSSRSFRDGVSRMTTHSLPNNLTENDVFATPHYVNEDVTNCCSSVDQAVNLRSSLTPPSLHNYANTTLTMTTDSNMIGRPNSLQEFHKQRTSEDTAQPTQVSDSILNLPVAEAAIKPPDYNGCRKGVLRGHSLDETTTNARLDDLLKQAENISAQKHLYMNVVPDNSNVQSKFTKDGCIAAAQLNQQHYNHHAGGGMFVRQKSVESSASSTTTCHHHRHHSNSISSDLTTAAPTTTTTSSSSSSSNSSSSSSNNNNNNNNSSSSSSAPSAVFRQVNYAVLDLNHRDRNKSSSSGAAVSMGVVAAVAASSGDVASTTPTSPVSLATPPPPESLTSPLEGYATIDFDRTVALSNVSSAHPCLYDDESVRKTRHNSTISDLLLSKHGSIVSND